MKVYRPILTNWTVKTVIISGKTDILSQLSSSLRMAAILGIEGLEKTLMASKWS